MVCSVTTNNNARVHQALLRINLAVYSCVRKLFHDSITLFWSEFTFESNIDRQRTRGSHVIRFDSRGEGCFDIEDIYLEENSIFPGLKSTYNFPHIWSYPLF